MKTVNDLPLMIALKILYLDIFIVSTQSLEIIIHRNVAVHSRLTHSEKIEIWAVDNKYFHRCHIFDLLSISDDIHRRGIKTRQCNELHRRLT